MRIFIINIRCSRAVALRKSVYSIQVFDKFTIQELQSTVWPVLHDRCMIPHQWKWKSLQNSLWVQQQSTTPHFDRIWIKTLKCSLERPVSAENTCHTSEPLVNPKKFPPASLLCPLQSRTPEYSLTGRLSTSVLVRIRFEIFSQNSTAKNSDKFEFGKSGFG